MSQFSHAASSVTPTSIMMSKSKQVRALCEELKFLYARLVIKKALAVCHPHFDIGILSQPHIPSHISPQNSNCLSMASLWEHVAKLHRLKIPASLVIDLTKPLQIPCLMQTSPLRTVSVWGLEMT